MQQVFSIGKYEICILFTGMYLYISTCILYDYMYRYMHMLSDLGGLNGHTCSGGFKYMFILASISANISRSTYNIGIDVNLCHQQTKIFHFQQVKHDFIHKSATAAPSMKNQTLLYCCYSMYWQNMAPSSS